MFYIDQFVYANKMLFFHPGEKVFFALSTMGICLTAKNPIVHLMVIGIMVCLLIMKAKIPGFVVGKLMLVPMGFLILGVITIACSWGVDSSGMLVNQKIGSYYIGVTEVGLRTAVITFLQALSSVTCLYFLALTVPMIDMIYILQLIKVPSILIELMMLIYRFIFVFVETAFNIYTAQSSRWGYCNFKRSIYSFGILFANLWGKVFMKSQALMNSMLSRGYESEIRVLHLSYEYSVKNILFFGLIDLGLIIITIVLPNNII